MNWAFTPDERVLLDSLRSGDWKSGVNRLAELTNPAAIPRLVELITAERKGATGDAILTIGRLLPQVPRSQLRRLDQEVRGHWISWGGGALKPRDVVRLAKRTGQPFVTAAICSMHRSGFVREEAVRRLSSATAVSFRISCYAPRTGYLRCERLRLKQCSTGCTPRTPNTSWPTLRSWKAARSRKVVLPS